MFGVLLACAFTNVGIAQSTGPAGEANQRNIGGLGGSLTPPTQVPPTYSPSGDADEFLNATPAQYPWYQLDDAVDAAEPALTSPPSTSPQGGWRSFTQIPRIQSVRGEYTIIIPSDGFGLAAVDLSMPLAVYPDGGVNGFFALSRFNWTFLSDPDGVDIPNHVFAVSLLRAEFWIPHGDCWLFNFVLEPSLYTDFDNMSSDALRLPGQAMAFYQFNPAWQLAAGVIHSDREDVSFIPAGGLIYRPSDRVRFDIICPRPKFAWQYGHDPCVEKWFYLLGEFGGSSWAVSRPGGDDVMTYRDLRILFGLEHKRKDQFNWWFEAGLVVGREVEFKSGVGDYDADPSLLGRVGMKF